MSPTNESQALTGFFVLDLSGPDGNYCGKLLAELGADVVLIEPPTGTPLRHQGPWLHGQEGVERSIAFSYLNSSKRSAVLDIETPLGRIQFAALIRRADLVIDSAAGAQDLDAAGFDFESMTALNKQLVRTTITPFGLEGPYAGRPASDLTCLAEGGMLSLVGYPDQPVALPYEQAYLAAGQFAAVGSLLALVGRDVIGEGQRVDVSIQESVVLALENAAQTFDLEGTVRERRGTKQRLAGAGMFRCADGYVMLLAGGIGGHRFWPNLLEMMEASTPGSTSGLLGSEWTQRDYLPKREAKVIFREIFEGFAAPYTRNEIDHMGRRFRVPVAPVNSIATASASEQLASRGYFVDLDVAGDGPVVMPGAPYLLSQTPWRSTHRAPRLGEHTTEVLSRFSSDERAVGRAGSGVAR